MPVKFKLTWKEAVPSQIDAYDREGEYSFKTHINKPSEEITMAQNLAEILDLSKILGQNLDHSKSSNPTTFAEYVSDALSEQYPRISPELYKLQREIVVIPENHEKILEAFHRNVQVKGAAASLVHDACKTIITIPLLVEAPYGRQEQEIALLEEKTIIKYEITAKGEKIYLSAWDLDNFDVKLGQGRREEGRDDVSIHVKGEWIYAVKLEPCMVKVPSLPGDLEALEAESQALYFNTIRDAKKQGHFRGQQLPNPELKILWIPLEEQFSVKVKEVPIPVHRDPALILRIDNKYDHVVALWDDEKEIPLDFLIKQFSERR
ncbi:MAG: hypothetical protein AABX05_05305 [Nanoarchaeota archaeon]